MSGWFADGDRSVRQSACPWCLKPIGIPRELDPPECLRCETCGGTWVMTTMPKMWLAGKNGRAKQEEKQLPKTVKLSSGGS